MKWDTHNTARGGHMCLAKDTDFVLQTTVHAANIYGHKSYAYPS